VGRNLQVRPIRCDGNRSPLPRREEIRPERDLSNRGNLGLTLAENFDTILNMENEYTKLNSELKIKLLRTQMELASILGTLNVHVPELLQNDKFTCYDLIGRDLETIRVKIKELVYAK